MSLDQELSKIYVIDVSQLGERGIKKWILRSQKEILRVECESKSN